MKTKIFGGILIATCLGCQNLSHHPAPTDTLLAFQTTKAAIDWVGTYTNETGIVLKINEAPVVEGRLKFELIQSTPNCMESIHGTANLIKSDVATYTEHDTVSITLMYKKDQVNISEIGVSHGQSCNTFNGTYKKDPTK